MSRRGPSRKQRSKTELKATVWRMPSQEVCQEAIAQILRPREPAQPSAGVPLYQEEHGAHYLVYLIGPEMRDPLGLQRAAHATVIRHAGGVLCVDKVLAYHLKWKAYEAYQNQR